MLPVQRSTQVKAAQLKYISGQVHLHGYTDFLYINRSDGPGLNSVHVACCSLPAMLAHHRQPKAIPLTPSLLTWKSPFTSLKLMSRTLSPLLLAASNSSQSKLLMLLVMLL